MRKVGLAVVAYKNNYGSMLQTYATQAIMVKLGFRPEIIRIEPFRNIIRRAKIRFFLKRARSSEERRYVWSMLSTKIRRSIPSRFAKDSKIRDRKYNEFVNNRFLFSPSGMDRSGVIERCREFDAVIVGSDQLWLPSNIEADFFTLSFVPDEVKKIAYATSFGVERLPGYQHAKARRFLSRIEHVSVREEAGRAMVKEITGRNVPVVCDPSMLLDGDEWMAIQNSAPLITGSYVLCYFLGDNPVFRAFARRLAAEERLQVVGLLHGATYISGDDGFPDFALYDVGPSEFINLIRNAAFVCTDSFHGVVFSILNRKRFFAFKRFSDDSDLSTNDRLRTLLSWSGLKQRMVSGREEARECVSREIDYSQVLERVAEKREEGISFLRMALESGLEDT
jgi:hypothetical protein